jgi:tetratricopeptide (TPR) repeat protein
LALDSGLRATVRHCPKLQWKVARAIGCIAACFIGWVEAKEPDARSSVVLHAIRGKVIPVGGQPLGAAKVRLTTSDGQERGERVLAYEGTFSFEELSPGGYLLTLDRQDDAMIGRPIEIKNYPVSKVVFLEITLNKESASVREIVTDASNRDFGTLKEQPSEVSRKALRSFEQAAKESAAGSPEKAIVHLQRAIREQPNYFEAYNNLGVQYQKLQRWNEAVRAYRRATELRPNSAKAHINLAVVFLEQGQTGQAVDSLEAARKADPGSATVHLLLGQIYLRKKDYLNAQEQLETATRLNPQSSRQAFVLLIEIALHHHEVDRARQYLDVMKQYFPPDSDISSLQEKIQAASKP